MIHFYLLTALDWVDPAAAWMLYPKHRQHWRSPLRMAQIYGAYFSGIKTKVQA